MRCEVSTNGVLSVNQSQLIGPIICPSRCLKAVRIFPGLPFIIAGSLTVIRKVPEMGTGSRRINWEKLLEMNLKGNHEEVNISRHILTGIMLSISQQYYLSTYLYAWCTESLYSLEYITYNIRLTN